DETAIEERNTGHGMNGVGLSMDPVFVKLTSSPVFMHPSFAGSADKSRLTAAYRNQMPSFPGNLVTYYLSFDTYISALHSGVAIISYYNDALQGMVNSWYNGFVISPKIRIRENISVEPAIQLGYLAMRVDEGKLSELNNTDPNYGYTYDASMNSSGSLNNSHLLDLSGGLLLQWSKFYGGFSIEHITQAMKDPTDAAFIPRRYSVQGGVSLKRYRNSDFTCSPNIQFDMQYKTTTLLWSSAFSYKSLIWGVGFGNQDRFVVMLGLQKNKFRFGYNFDSQLAKLGSNAASAHELSLRYYFSKKDQNGSGKTDDVVTLLR
ncbi:MAG: PorP/SprF family type IX secretion system membrane protein, partial [Flavobacteriales bacterium]